MNVKQKKGFTLLEMLLVLAIMSSIVVMIIGFVTQKTAELRRDRVSLQIQQILNAALAYYVDHSAWPIACGGTTPWFDMNSLQSSGYLLPNNPLPVNPWGNGFSMSCDTGGKTFSVKTNVVTPTDAVIVSGRLPFGFVSNTAGSNTSPPTRGACTITPPYAAGCNIVVSSVSVPGQNLNDARAVNFAGIYSNGACVPAPVCPAGMKPKIYVAPAEVTGNSWFDATGTFSNRISPISSFSAFARGKDIATGEPGNPDQVLDCKVENTPAPRTCNMWSGSFGNPTVTPDPAGTTFWRVCLTVITSDQRVTFPTNPSEYPQGVVQGRQTGSIMALTKCVPNDGTDIPAGSPFGYFEPNHSSLP